MKFKIWLPLMAGLITGVQSGPAYSQDVAVDNSDCLVCHMNFKKEELARRHQLRGIGCITCHGPSTAHADDEENTTPPDIMWPKQKVNSSCQECHAKEKSDETHKTVLAGTAAKNKYCTDCHGKHRLPVRTVQWNKRTGELLAGESGK